MLSTQISNAIPMQILLTVPPAFSHYLLQTVNHEWDSSFGEGINWSTRKKTYCSCCNRLYTCQGLFSHLLDSFLHIYCICIIHFETSFIPPPPHLLLLTISFPLVAFYLQFFSSLYILLSLKDCHYFYWFTSLLWYEIQSFYRHSLTSS